MWISHDFIKFGLITMFIQQGCSELNCWSGLGSATQFVCLGTEQLIPTYLPPKVKEEGLQMESLSWSTMDFYSSQWGQNNQTSQTDPFLLIAFSLSILSCSAALYSVWIWVNMYISVGFNMQVIDFSARHWSSWLLLTGLAMTKELQFMKSVQCSLG